MSKAGLCLRACSQGRQTPQRVVRQPAAARVLYIQPCGSAHLVMSSAQPLAGKLRCVRIMGFVMGCVCVAVAVAVAVAVWLGAV